MKGKKLLALLLVVSMVICMMQVPIYATNEATEDAASQFADMPDNWATNALKNAVANGLLVGSGGKILPNDYLTRAQMAAIIVRAFNANVKADISRFVDVKPTDWFADSIAKAYQMGVIVGSNDKMNPTSYISRQEVCAIMARAFKLEPEKTLNKTFADADKISDWAKGEVYAVVNAGYIQGYNGNLDPLGYVTRAQFAVIFDNFVKQYIRTAGVYETVADGNIMINVPGVTLKNVKINGDLIIGDGVGDGEVILDNVVITGRMVVRGGGENSVIIRGSSSVSKVIVSRVDGAVSVKVEGDANVEVIYIDDGSDDVNIEGAVGSIEIQASDITVTTKGAKIGAINVSGKNASLVIDENTVVETIDVAGQAANTTMNVSGKVNKVTTQAPKTEIAGNGEVGEVQVQSGANDSRIETPNTKISVSEGVTGVKGGGGTELKPGETVTNNNQGTGVQTPPVYGGGGGGSGPSRVAVRAVRLDKEKLILEVGATDKLTATVEPANATNKNIIWTSSDEEVAAVDSTGKVTAVASGEAVITVKTEDGGFTAACTVRVVNNWSELADTTWYSDEIDSFTISSAEELAGLALLVNSEDNPINFTGKTITLEADIDLLGIEWVPIGFINEQVEITKADEYTRCANVFKGTFDGNNKTIYNLKVDKSKEKAVGLFGVVNLVDGATIKDVVIENAFINGFTGVGALAGMATSDSKWVSGIGHEARISGIEVRNSSISGLKYVGGVIGYSTVSIKESTVSNTEVAAYYVTGMEDRISSGETAGGIVGNLYDNFSITSCSVTDCYITSQTRAGGIAGSSRYARDISYCTVENTTITLVEGEDEKAENEGYAGYVSGRAENAVINASSDNEIINCKAIIYGTETIIYPFCTPVSKVTVKQNAITMLVGENKNIEATIEPANVSYKKVIYSSSNENVAAVDSDGNVEAISPGSATITAISAADPSKKATVSVIVTPIYNETSKTAYNSLNEAINGAADGDTILMGSATYTVTETILVNKVITIKGAPNFATKFVTSGDNSVFNIRAAATLDGVLIQKTDSSTQALVIITSDKATIKNSKFLGVYTQGSSEISRAIVPYSGIKEFTIIGNHFESLRQPAYFNGGNTGVVQDNYVTNTRGWVVCGDSNIIFIGNTFDSNAVDIAIIPNNNDVNNYGTTPEDIIALSQSNNGAYVENQLSKISAKDGKLYKTVSITSGDKTSYFSSIQDAINAAQRGDNIIKVYPGDYGTGSIDIIQKDGVNLTLEAAGEVTLKNQIRISGAGRHNGEETLTIKGFTFDFSDAASGVDIILATKKLLDDTNNYAHNIKIENNLFIGNLNVVAIRTQGAFGLEISSCEAIGLHSLGQINGQSKYFRVVNCTVTGGKNGINYYGPSDLSVDNFTFSGTGYGIRAGQSSGNLQDSRLTIINSVLISNGTEDDSYPVILRGDAPKDIEISDSKLIGQNQCVIYSTVLNNGQGITLELNNNDFGEDGYQSTILFGLDQATITGNDVTDDINEELVTPQNSAEEKEVLNTEYENEAATDEAENTENLPNEQEAANDNAQNQTESGEDTDSEPQDEVTPADQQDEL